MNSVLSLLELDETLSSSRVGDSAPSADREVSAKNMDALIPLLEFAGTYPEVVDAAARLTGHKGLLRLAGYRGDDMPKGLRGSASVEEDSHHRREAAARSSLRLPGVTKLSGDVGASNSLGNLQPVSDVPNPYEPIPQLPELDVQPAAPGPAPVPGPVPVTTDPVPILVPVSPELVPEPLEPVVPIVPSFDGWWGDVRQFDPPSNTELRAWINETVGTVSAFLPRNATVARSALARLGSLTAYSTDSAEFYDWLYAHRGIPSLHQVARTFEKRPAAEVRRAATARSRIGDPRLLRIEQYGLLRGGGNGDTPFLGGDDVVNESKTEVQGPGVGSYWHQNFIGTHSPGGPDQVRGDFGQTIDRFASAHMHGTYKDAYIYGPAATFAQSHYEWDGLAWVPVIAHPDLPGIAPRTTTNEQFKVTPAGLYASMFSVTEGISASEVSSPMRINNVLISGQAELLHAALVGDNLLAGRNTSAADILCRILLMMRTHQWYDAASCDRVAGARCTIANPMPPVAILSSWPLSGVGVVNVEFRVCSMSDAILAAARMPMQNGQMCPVGWNRDTWGVTTAVVPIRTAWLDDARLNASWCSVHMEYPRNRRIMPGGLNVLGVDEAGPGVLNYANYVRVPGPITQVLLVLTDYQGTGDMQVALDDGAGFQVTIAANSLSGASVVRPAFHQFDSGPDAYLCLQRWSQICGNGWDWETSVNTVADASHWWMMPDRRTGALLVGSFFATPPGPGPYVEPDWDTRYGHPTSVALTRPWSECMTSPSGQVISRWRTAGNWVRSWGWDVPRHEPLIYLGYASRFYSADSELPSVATNLGEGVITGLLYQRAMLMTGVFDDNCALNGITEQTLMEWNNTPNEQRGFATRSFKMVTDGFIDAVRGWSGQNGFLPTWNSNRAPARVQWTAAMAGQPGVVAARHTLAFRRVPVWVLEQLYPEVWSYNKHDRSPLVPWKYVKVNDGIQRWDVVTDLNGMNVGLDPAARVPWSWVMCRGGWIPAGTAGFFVENIAGWFVSTKQGTLANNIIWHVGPPDVGDSRMAVYGRVGFQPVGDSAIALPFGGMPILIDPVSGGTVKTLALVNHRALLLSDTATPFVATTLALTTRPVTDVDLDSNTADLSAMLLFRR